MTSPPAPLPPPVSPAPSGGQPPTASNAVVALILGILGIILCPICAPIAWSTGGKAKREIDGSADALGGRGLATAGRILGIVGSCLLVVYVVFFVVWVVVFGLLTGGELWLLNEASKQP